jgi:hypothetical protein
MSSEHDASKYGRPVENASAALPTTPAEVAVAKSLGIDRADEESNVEPEGEPSAIIAELETLYTDVARGLARRNPPASAYIEIPEHIRQSRQCRRVSIELKIRSLLISGAWKTSPSEDLMATYDGREMIQRG